LSEQGRVKRSGKSSRSWRPPHGAARREDEHDARAGFAIPERIIRTTRRGYDYLPKNVLEQPEFAAYLAEEERKEDASILEAGRRVAARLTDAGIKLRRRTEDAHAYHVTLGQAYMIVLYRWSNAALAGHSPTPPHPGSMGGLQGLRAVIDEYERITEAAEVRYGKRHLSLDARARGFHPSEDASGGATLLDFTESPQFEPTEAVEQRERVRILTEGLSDQEARTLERIVYREPVLDERDKKARQRLRRKLRTRDAKWSAS